MLSEYYEKRFHEAKDDMRLVKFEMQLRERSSSHDRCLVLRERQCCYCPEEVLVIDAAVYVELWFTLAKDIERRRESGNTSKSESFTRRREV